MKSKNIVILTGNDCRHQYFIHHLSAEFSISEIFIEAGNFPSPSSQSKEESIAWEWFFQRQTVAKVKKANPGFLAVFGTSILKKPILNVLPNQCFNLHIGDPEYYRGSSCNFWPIYQKKLNHLSATIHRIDQNIDTGEILSRQAVTLQKSDNEQTLLLKPLILGTKLMIKIIKQWQGGLLQSFPQNKTGKLYKKADFNPEVILKFKQMVESGELNTLIQASSVKTLAGIEL
jgi:methionyl-tRNA formyltransferase